MEYTVSASYYGRGEWPEVWAGQESVTVPPGGSAEVDVTLAVPDDMETGVYQGFVKFEGDTHTVNAPVSFVVKTPVTASDSSVLIMGVEGGDAMFGNGYTRGAFDMTSRYMAGDWRQYYFDVQDEAINSAAIKMSWVSDRYQHCHVRRRPDRKDSAHERPVRGVWALSELAVGGLAWHVAV